MSAFTSVVWSATGVSSSVSSGDLKISTGDEFAIQAVATGSLVGTIGFQLSADGVTWDDVANSAKQFDATHDVTFIGKKDPAIHYQLVFVWTSGTGGITATENAKVQ